MRAKFFQFTPIPLMVLCLYCCLIISCSKSDSPIKKDAPGANQTAGHISGMGASHDALIGDAFVFSNNVEIKGGIKAVDFIYPGSGYCQVVGSGAFVLVSMEFVNKTDKDTLLVFPAGLTFESTSTEDQNGMLIQNTQVSLTKGGTCNTLFYAYCTNEHRSGSSIESKYAFGPICNAAPIRELIDLLKNKKVNLDPGEAPSILGPIGVIQDCLWKITDGEGLSADDKRAIQALEDK